MNQVEDVGLLDQKVTSWHDTHMRWLALGMACLFQLGSYYCTDFPSVLGEELEATFNVTSQDVNMLYTLYSLPNVVMPLLGGLLIDKVGIRTGLVGFYVLLIMGQSMCMIGAIVTQYWWLYAGRFMFGLGGENCVVAQSTIVSKWFTGKETALALGLNITFARFGSIIQAWLTPKTYYDFNDSMTAAMLIGVLFLLFSWVDGMLLAYMDKKSDERDGAEIKIEQDKISCKDVKEFKMDFYLLTLSCLVSYTGFFLFQQNNVDMFVKIYNIEKSTATTFYSIPFYMAAFVTPLIGILIDRMGHRTLMLIVSGIILTIVNLMYYFAPECSGTESCYLYPGIAQSLLGIFYAIYAAVMWPCVPLCVPERTVGTAFGIVNAVQNIGLAVAPIIVGRLIGDKSYGEYQHMMLFFIGMALAALASNIALHFYDSRVNGGKMAKPSREAAQENTEEVRQSRANSSLAGVSIAEQKEFFKQKVLLIFGYNGEKYHGLQMQKTQDVETIESRLYSSLFDSNLIGKASFGDLSKSGWSRGARTDKGVHALCNAIAVKLLFTKDHLKESHDEYLKGRDKFLIDFPRVINEINSNLPLDIRVHSIKLTTQGFDVRKNARSRFYEYIAPLSLYGNENHNEVLERVERLIKKFEGTHNFHNYSRGLKFKDPSANRYILKMSVEPFEYKGQNFMKFLLNGQSFVYHQIRKMMGIIIQIFQEGLPDNFIDNTFFQNQLRLLLAPAEGLFLNRITFDGYNRKIAEIPQPIDYEPEDQIKINQFRPLIVDRICEREIADQVFTKWLQSMKDINFQLENVVESDGQGDD